MLCVHMQQSTQKEKKEEIEFCFGPACLVQHRIKKIIWRERERTENIQTQGRDSTRGTRISIENI